MKIRSEFYFCIIIVYIFLGMLLNTIFAAEVSDEVKVYQEEEVIVTATRTEHQKNETPGTTEVINEEDIENSKATTVAEILAEEGIVISTSGDAFSVATVQLDGFSAEQTLVLVNGIPASTGTTGTVDLSFFPLTGVQKIEVVHGPLSALYGSNALGGVVNIITDLTGEPQTNLAFIGGSNNFGNATLVIRQPNFGLALNGLITDGFRDNTETSRRSFMAQYDLIHHDSGYLILDVLHLVKDSQNPGPQKTPPDDKVDEYAITDGINLRGRYRLGTTELEYKIFNQSVDYRYQSPIFPARHQLDTFGTDIAGIYDLGNHQILSGIMLRKDKFESTSTGDHSQNNGAFYFQDEWTLNDNWKFISGLRWDTGSDYSSPVSPRINLVTQISDNFTLKFGYGKAFRVPTVNDLYWPEDLWTAGNPNLKPEKSERFEIAGEWNDGYQFFGINIFQAKVIDGINWGMDSLKYRPVNIDKLRVDGSIIYWRNQWNDIFSTGLRYTWTDKQKWNDVSQEYDQDLNYFGSQHWTVNFNIKQERWFANLDGYFVANRSEQTDPVTFTKVDMPDYHYWNLGFGYQANQNLQYKLNINNLTDEEYQIHSRYPMPGREYYLSLNYTF